LKRSTQNSAISADQLCGLIHRLGESTDVSQFTGYAHLLRHLGKISKFYP
jgi:hypothetical protein